MGYYATGNGDIVLSKWDKTIADILADEFEFDVYNEYNVVNEAQCTEISVWSSEKYHGDAVEEILKEITPYTIEGSIRYSGEDDCLWEFYFDQESKQWVEGNVTVIYPSDTIAPAGHEEIEDRQERVKTLLAEILIKQFKDMGIDSDFETKPLLETAEAYKELIDGTIQNESWLQEYIDGEDISLRQADLERALMSSVFSWIRNMCE